jgi:putative transposase
MARLPRLSAPGQLHLTIQQVHQRLPVFADATDRQAYLECLAEAAARHQVAIHGYGIAPDEVRLLATPNDGQALGRMIQFIGRRFVAGLNRRHARHGALWDGRFRATVVEPLAYFLPCLRYVESAAERKPSDAAADNVPWSSAEHHAGRRSDPFVTEHARYWSLGNTPFEREAAYRSAMHQPVAEAEIQGIALASLHGWVLGSPEFERLLAGQLGRRLRPLPPGRPSTKTHGTTAEISDPE